MAPQVVGTRHTGLLVYCKAQVFATSDVKWLRISHYSHEMHDGQSWLSTSQL